jgi:hypothetical protein
MNPLASSAIAALVRQGLAGRARAAVGRLSVPLVCGLIALHLVLAATVLLTMAFWNLLLPAIGPVWTPVALAGALLMLAAIPVAIVWSHAHRHRAEQLRVEDVERMIEPMLAQARQFTRDNQGTTLVAAILAGVAAGLASRD